MSDPLSALRAISGTDATAGATTLPNIPAVPYTEDSSLTNILSSMKLWMEKAAGSGLTGFASKKDLIDAGILAKDETGSLTPTADVSLSIPPVPSGLIATGAMTTIVLEWVNPRVTYPNHAYAEVWAAETDNFSTAGLVGQAPGMMFPHAVGEDSTRYYWLRFVSKAGVQGPFNAVGGTLGQTSQNPTYLLDVMSGILADQPFFTVTAPTVINGVTIPVGTYMKSAFIAEATISRAMIQSAAIDSAKIADAAIVTAKIADAQITAAKIQSIDAGSITTGTLSADRIDTNTLVAKNVSVNTSGSGARLVMTNSVIKVYDAVGALRVQIGDLEA